MDHEYEVDLDLELASEDVHDGSTTGRASALSVSSNEEDANVVSDEESESFGYNGQPIYFIDNDTILHLTANSIKITSLETGTKRHIWGFGNGLSCVAAHPKTERLAFADKTYNPSIYIINYARNTKICTLQGGAKVEFVDLAFSRDGKYLASIGGIPDFKLVVWDLSTQRPLVQANGASCRQVSFNPRNSMQLCTSGDGSLTFWKLEKNYTQYSLTMEKARLTKTPPLRLVTDSADDLSPVVFSAHCWNTQNEVYCASLANPGELYCFSPQSTASLKDYTITNTLQVSDRQITVLCVTANFVVAATAGGYIHWISKSDYTVSNTYQFSSNGDIQTLAITPDYVSGIIAGTSSGTVHALATVEPPADGIFRARKILDCHVGPITGIECLPHGHQMVTCGYDGTVRVWDYLERSSILASKVTFSTHFTSLSAARKNVLAVGSETGVLRVFQLRPADSKRDPMLIHQVKLHNVPVHKVKYHPEGLYIVTAGKGDNQVCIIDSTTPEFKVMGYVSLPSNVTCLAWHATSDLHQIFVGTEAGNLFRLVPPSAPAASLRLANKDVQKSLLKLSSTVRAVVVDPRTSGAKKQNRTGDPELMGELDVSLSKEEYKFHDKPSSSLTVSPNEKWLASGGQDGTVAVRSIDLIKKTFVFKGHDAYLNGVAHISFSYDSRYLLSAGADDPIIFRRPCRVFDPFSALIPPTGIRPMFSESEVKPVYDDAQIQYGPTALEVREKQLQAIVEESHKQAKKKLLEKFSHLQEIYNDIVRENNTAPDIEKLSEDELIIDTAKRDRLVAEGDNLVKALKEEIRAENLARDLLIHRLKVYCYEAERSSNWFHSVFVVTEFYDSMEEHGIYLKPLKDNFTVPNYPLRKASAEETENLQKIRLLRRLELREFKLRKLEAEKKGIILSPPPTTPTTTPLQQVKSQALMHGSMRELELYIPQQQTPADGSNKSTPSNTKKSTVQSMLRRSSMRGYKRKNSKSYRSQNGRFFGPPKKIEAKH